MMMKAHCDDQPAPSMKPIQNKQAPRMVFSATQGLGAKTQGGKTKAPLPKKKASLVKNRVYSLKPKQPPKHGIGICSYPLLMAVL